MFIVTFSSGSQTVDTGSGSAILGPFEVKIIERKKM
jgi:hypothetical protein